MATMQFRLPIGAKRQDGCTKHQFAHSDDDAGDGQEALEALRTKEIGLVLSDINMPKMDGLQLLAAMKNTPQWRDIPVVMITTEGGETKVGEAVKLGAVGYVRKPFTADQIKEKLAGILEAAVQQ